MSAGEGKTHLPAEDVPDIQTPEASAPRVFHCKRIPSGIDPGTVIYVARPNLSIPKTVTRRLHQFANPYRNPNRKRSEILALYRTYISACPSLVTEARQLLRGNHLCCWCENPAICHASILLEIANAPEKEEPPAKA